MIHLGPPWLQFPKTQITCQLIIKHLDQFWNICQLKSHFTAAKKATTPSQVFPQYCLTYQGVCADLHRSWSSRRCWQCRMGPKNWNDWRCWRIKTVLLVNIHSQIIGRGLLRDCHSICLFVQTRRQAGRTLLFLRVLQRLVSFWSRGCAKMIFENFEEKSQGFAISGLWKKKDFTQTKWLRSWASK